VPIFNKEMKKIFVSAMFLFVPFWMVAQDVVGKWKLESGTAIVEVYRSGDVFNGKIVWLKKQPDLMVRQLWMKIIQITNSVRESLWD